MNKKPYHIGVVGCSSEGAALCYKTICIESAKILGAHAHPEVSIHTHSLADYVACLNDADIKGVGDLMVSSANKLQQAGADFLICPDNTIHQAFHYAEEHSALPWLHIADVVVQEAVEQGYQKIGILGTEWLVNSDVYPASIEKYGLSWQRPSAEQIKPMSQMIMDELVVGEFKPKTINYFKRLISCLKDQGCDSVVLGCTEIPLIINDSNADLPTLDSNRLLALAAIRKALSASV